MALLRVPTTPAVKSAVSRPSRNPATVVEQRKVVQKVDRVKNTAAPALLAVFAAFQVLMLPPGPALAEVYAAPQESVDVVADAGALAAPQEVVGMVAEEEEDQT